MVAPGGAVTRPTSTSPCSHPGTGRWELVFLAAAVVGVILGAHPRQAATPCGEARQSARWWTDLAERRPVCLGPEHVVRTTSPPAATSPPRSHQVTAPTPPWCCPLDDGHLPQGARCAGAVDLSSIRSVPPLVEYPAAALFVQLTSCQQRHGKHHQRSPGTTSMHARHQAEAPEVRVVARVVVLQVGRQQDSCRMDGAPVAVQPAPTRARVPRLRCIDLVPRRRRVLHHPSRDPSLHRRRPHSRRSSMCVSMRGRARQTGGGSVCVRARRDGGDAQTMLWKRAASIFLLLFLFLFFPV